MVLRTPTAITPLATSLLRAASSWRLRLSVRTPTAPKPISMSTRTRSLSHTLVRGHAPRITPHQTATVSAAEAPAPETAPGAANEDSISASTKNPPRTQAQHLPARQWTNMRSYTTPAAVCRGLRRHHHGLDRVVDVVPPTLGGLSSSKACVSKFIAGMIRGT